MRPFSINIRGRVKNFNLPKNQPLVPLFEAIVNAIHAIGERKSTDPSFEGQIIIRILRDGQFVLDGTGELPQIQSFEIIDNGIGYDFYRHTHPDDSSTLLHRPQLDSHHPRQTWFYGEEHMAELQLQMHHRLTI